MEPQRHRVFVFLIALAAVLAYARQLDTYFLKDDFNIVLMARPDGSFDADRWFHEFIWPDARTWDYIWRPIPALTWAAEFAIFGADPTGLHLGQVFFHAICAVLIYWVVNRLTSFRRSAAGFFAGLFFALYPLHPEAVVWLTQRTVLMGLMFSLLAILAYDVWLHGRKRRHLVAAWAFVALATLSREHGLPLPAVFCVLALLAGPAATRRERWTEIGRVCGVYALFVAAYFGCRYAIWGAFLSPYSGFESNTAYASANRVWERLFDETLLGCFAPAAQTWFDRPIGDGLPNLLTTIRGAFLSLWGIAALLLLRAAGSHRDARSFLAVVIAFSVVSWVPVAQVFWTDYDLLNSRSGYHIMALLVGALGAMLVNPWSRRDGSGGWMLLVPGLIAVGLAIVLQTNLRAFTGGDTQIRGIQRDLLRAAESASPDAVHVVFDVPSQFAGCTTLDAYLPLLTRPPLAPIRVETVPFVFQPTASWLRDALDPNGAYQTAIGDGKSMEFYVPAPQTLGVRPLFGVDEDPKGDEPCVPQFPDDGALVFAVEGGLGIVTGISSGQGIAGMTARNFDPKTAGLTAGPGWPVWTSESLPLVFQVPESATELILHFESQDGTFAFPLGSDVQTRVGNSVVVHLRDVGKDRGGLWPPPPAAPFRVAGFRWRVEALDHTGRSVGLSAPRRLVLINALRTAP